MKRLVFALIALTVLVGLLAFPAGATTVVTPTASQKWFLDQSAGAESGTSIMLRGNNAVSGFVSIPAGGHVTWLSDETAKKNVTFPTGSWMVHLITDENWNHKTPGIDTPLCDVEVGAYSSGMFLTIPGSKAYMDYYLLQIIMDSEGVDPSNPAVVPVGDYLYLTVYNRDDKAHFVSFSGGGSVLISPSSDPGYPLPELSTAILFGLGLAGIGTIIVIRKRQQKKTGVAV